MKKILSLVMVFFTLNTFSQNHFKSLSRDKLPKKLYPQNINRSTNNISLDYDSFDRIWATQHSSQDSMNLVTWNINQNNSNDSIYSLKYVIQSYDTLIDVNNNFAGIGKQNLNIQVDSFDLFLGAVNTSGDRDTMIVSLFDKNMSCAGQSGELNLSTIWSEISIVDSNSFPVPGDIYSVRFRPNKILPVGHTFGIKVEFKGNNRDQLLVAASYRTQCYSQNFSFGDTNKIAPRNSSYYLNNGINSGFYNYDTNYISGVFNPLTTCNFFYIQNFLFYPYLTLMSGSPANNVTIISTGTMPFCENIDSVTLVANANFGNNCANVYAWSNGVHTASNTISTGGTYTVTVNANGISASSSVNISTYPLPYTYFTIVPDLNTSHVWQAVNQCTGTNLSYLWNWGDNSIAGTGATPTHTYSTAGNYNICIHVSDANGCSNQYCDSSTYIFKSDNQVIQVNVVQYATDIDDAGFKSQNIEYYNHAIRFSEEVTLPTAIRLYDLTGRVVWGQEKYTGSLATINTDPVAGVYIISLQNSKYTVSKKILILQ